MRRWTRALMTLLAAAAAGFLLWFAPHFNGRTSGGYWGAIGVIAAAGAAARPLAAPRARREPEGELPGRLRAGARRSGLGDRCRATERRLGSRSRPLLEWRDRDRPRRAQPHRARRRARLRARDRVRRHLRAEHGPGRPQERARRPRPRAPRIGRSAARAREPIGAAHRCRSCPERRAGVGRPAALERGRLGGPTVVEPAAGREQEESAPTVELAATSARPEEADPGEEEPVDEREPEPEPEGSDPEPAQPPP